MSIIVLNESEKENLAEEVKNNKIKFVPTYLTTEQYYNVFGQARLSAKEPNNNLINIFWNGLL